MRRFRKAQLTFVVAMLFLGSGRAWMMPDAGQTALARSEQNIQNPQPEELVIGNVGCMAIPEGVCRDSCIDCYANCLGPAYRAIHGPPTYECMLECDARGMLCAMDHALFWGMIADPSFWFTPID